MARAAVNGNFESVRLLVEKGAVLFSVNKDGKTALMLAKENGHQEMVDYLLVQTNALGKDSGERYAGRGFIKPA